MPYLFNKIVCRIIAAGEENRMKLIKILFGGILVLLAFSSCNTAKLSTAEAQFAKGEYYDAALTYRKIYNKTSSGKQRKLKGEIAYKMATCYRLLNAAPRSTAAYQNAVRYNYPDSLAYYYLGRSLQLQGKYKDAVKNYTIYLQNKPEDLLARNGIRGCEQAPDWKKNPTRYVVKKATLFNSRRSEFCPMLYGKDFDQLYFTSSNDKALGDRKSEITGLKNNDIFLVKKNEKGEWQRPEIIEGELNSEVDEGAICFSPDGTTMYLTKARREVNTDTSVEIYTSSRSGAKWSAPQKLEITGDTISAFGHPAVSPDGLYLYFASDMPGGYGGKDIWRVPLSDKGVGPVENLGERINTPGNEMFPYVRANGELYFSSDGLPGMGGLDIFRATENEYGFWNVENMKAPINSAADDFGITFGNGEEGFFSSNRGDGRGYEHLFSFALPTIQVWVEGYVLDRDEEIVSDPVIRLVGKDGTNMKITGKKDGTYRFRVSPGVEYVMMAGCKGYLNQRQYLTTEDEEKDETYYVDFLLPSMTKPVLVENIFYEFDKATLTPESTGALKELITMLNDNPNVTIELSAHTDMKGTDEYNQRLSDRRAQAVVDYLIKGGIEPERLTPKGYGKGTPKTVTKKLAAAYSFLKIGDVLTGEFILNLPPDQQEIANQINRRTEFRVLNTSYGIY